MIKRKTAVIITALVLLLGCFVGGTVAYLTASTGTITNTFTVGNVSITLKETKPDSSETVESGDVSFKSVPGSSVTKDAKVSVDNGSEACWLFVKIVETNATIDGVDILSYIIADGWTKYSDTGNIYYREVSTSEIGKDFSVFKDNKVTYSENITSAIAAEMNAEKKPTIAVSAAAVQKENISDVTTAYNQLPDEFKS